MGNKEFDPIKFLENYSLPPLEVRHKNLPRVGDSDFKTECPNCKTGILLVRRNMETFFVENEDHCNHCGIRVKYIDIEKNSMAIIYKQTK